MNNKYETGTAVATLLCFAIYYALIIEKKIEQRKI